MVINGLFFLVPLEKAEFELTDFPGMHWKDLELSLGTRFHSRYLRESVSMLQFNSQGQSVREARSARVE